MSTIALADETDYVATLRRPILAVVQCPACGYEPPRRDHPPKRCPKCYGGCWERFIWQGRLIDAEPAD